MLFQNALAISLCNHEFSKQKGPKVSVGNDLPLAYTEIFSADTRKLLTM